MTTPRNSDPNLMSAKLVAHEALWRKWSHRIRCPRCFRLAGFFVDQIPAFGRESWTFTYEQILRHEHVALHYTRKRTLQEDLATLQRVGFLRVERTGRAPRYSVNLDPGSGDPDDGSARGDGNRHLRGDGNRHLSGPRGDGNRHLRGDGNRHPTTGLGTTGPEPNNNRSTHSVAAEPLRRGGSHPSSSALEPADGTAQDVQPGARPAVRVRSRIRPPAPAAATPPTPPTRKHIAWMRHQMRDAWETAYTATFPSSRVPAWTGKEKGQVADILCRLDYDLDAAKGLVTWSITYWRGMCARDLKGLRVVPEYPTPAALVTFFTRFHSAWSRGEERQWIDLLPAEEREIQARVANGETYDQAVLAIAEKRARAKDREDREAHERRVTDLVRLAQHEQRELEYARRRAIATAPRERKTAKEYLAECDARSRSGPRAMSEAEIERRLANARMAPWTDEPPAGDEAAD